MKTRSLIFSPQNQPLVCFPKIGPLHSLSEQRRKSVHRKLQILSSSDILEPNRGLTGPALKNWPSQDSDDEPDDVQPSMESIVSYPDDVTLQPGAVDSVLDEILQSERPDIMNDKHKLITLLTSDNAHSDLGKMIRESKENAARTNVGVDKDLDGPALVKTTSTECFFGGRLVSGQSVDYFWFGGP